MREAALLPVLAICLLYCVGRSLSGNAAGHILPPMIMFSYQRISAVIIENMPRAWSAGRSDNGWMTGESFYEYTSNVFYPWCISNEIEFPIIMYMDGHASHATNFCVEHKIELISLYPNSTPLTQPMDVALFRPLKHAWKKCVANWRIEKKASL